MERLNSILPVGAGHPFAPRLTSSLLYATADSPGSVLDSIPRHNISKEHKAGSNTLMLSSCNYSGKYTRGRTSNDVIEWRRFLMREYRLGDDISETVVSGQVGTRRPDREIFNIYLHSYQKSPSECVCVDNCVRHLRTAADVEIAENTTVR